LAAIVIGAGETPLPQRKKMMASVRKEILSVAARCFSVPAGKISLTRLAGDASARVFYRAAAGTGRRRRSLVFALYPPGEGEGITRWFRMAECLRWAGVGVPRAYFPCPEKGYLVMEDCGDDLLQTVVASASPRRVLSLYLRAVDEIVRMQNMRPEDYPVCPAWSLAFDLDKFLWELNFFLQHTVEGLWRARLSPAERREFARCFRRICLRALDLPFVFCHRDYHSRNLMVTRRKLKVIDFQDARMGPYAYDLASLLHDSYVSLPDGVRERTIAHYLRLLPDATGSISPERFREDFDMVSVQRLLKAAGTYGYMSEKGKEGYLRYLPAAMRSCWAILGRYPELGSLRDLLAKFCPSLT